jgi:hypothetical protein
MAAARRILAGDGRSGVPELDLRRGLYQKKEENGTNLARGLRGRFGRRSGCHGRGGGRCTSGGAGGARPKSGGEVLRHKNKGKGARKDCSPHDKNLGEGTGGGGVVAEEIELERSSLGGSGVA